MNHRAFAEILSALATHGWPAVCEWCDATIAGEHCQLLLKPDGELIGLCFECLTEPQIGEQLL